jgi:hypothetical protein
MDNKTRITKDLYNILEDIDCNDCPLQYVCEDEQGSLSICTIFNNDIKKVKINTINSLFYCN